MTAIKPILSAMLRSRSGPLLLLAQIILSVAIVANAAFIIQQRVDLMARPSGITESESFEFSVFNFGEEMDLFARDERDLEILRNLAGIKSAAPINMVPLSGSGWSDRFVDGPDPKNAKSLTQFAFYLSDEELVNALGLRLVEGRTFHKGQVASSSCSWRSTSRVRCQLSRFVPMKYSCSRCLLIFLKMPMRAAPLPVT